MFRINNGYDFLLQGVFRHVRELEDFMEMLENDFKIRSKHVWYVIDSLKQEAFLEDFEMIEMVKAGTSAKIS